MHFGSTLRLLRVDAGFTLRDLAERLGVSNAYLSRVENGHDAPPTPDRLIAIARTLGLPTTTLIELADRIEPLAVDYLETVPAARELLLDVVRRKLGPIDIARVRAFIEREFPLASTETRTDAAFGMFDDDRVVVGLTCGDLEDVIDVAAMRLVDPSKRADASSLAEAILRRERSCTTALGGGLAIPHAIVPDTESRAVIVTLRRPLRTSTPDGLPLRLVIVHVQPTRSSHTRCLATLARLAESHVVETASTRRSPREIVATIHDALGRTPA